MAKKTRHGKYAGEVEKIRMMRSLNEMLKTSDMENALLSNSARDSETVSDVVVDEMLNKIRATRSRDIGTVEKLIASNFSTAPQHQARSVKPSKPAARTKRMGRPNKMSHGRKTGRSGRAKR